MLSTIWPAWLGVCGEDYLRRIHEAMVLSGNDVDYYHALQKLAAHMAGQPVTYWCLFACSGIEIHFKRTVSELLQSQGLHIGFQPQLFAERNEDNRAWLMGQHPYVPICVADVNELEKDTVHNLVDGTRHCLLGPTDCVRGGVPCTSRTTLNNKSGKNINCVQDRREETGLAFWAQERALVKHSPLMLTNECSAALFTKSDEKTDSDNEYMNNVHRCEGYWAYSQAVQSVEWGSPADRFRGYWAGARGIKGPVLQVNEFFHRIHKSFRISADTYKLEDFIIFEDEARAKLPWNLGLPCHVALGDRVGGAGKKDPDFNFIPLNMF